MRIPSSAYALKCAAVLAVFLFLGAAEGSAQTTETEFSVYDSPPAPCPFRMNAVWRDAALGKWFWGSSERSGTLPSGSIQYWFVGTTLDNDWQATGYHLVAPSQCADAALQATVGIPAIIAPLRNARVTFVGVASGGGCVGKEDEASYDPNAGEDQVDPCAGGGGATPTKADGSPCAQETIRIEISDDNGVTWRVYYEGPVWLC